MNFAQLIHPCTIGEFFADHFEKSYLFSQRSQAGFYQEILNEDDLDQFFSQGDISPKGIRVVNNGTFISADQWTQASAHSPGTLIVQSEKLLKHYYEGATLVISGSENKFPRLAKACSAFERETKILIQANIYITPPNSQGFSMHYDDHDIFTLQIKGSKKWKFYDSGEELPTSKKPFSRTPEFLTELEVKAGDLLYMPRGLVHEAHSSTESSIHVNFSTGHNHGFNLLKELSALAEDEDVFFRKTVPHAFTTEQEIRDYTTEFAEKLDALISKHGIESLLQKHQEKFSEAQVIDRSGMFHDALAMENITAETRFQKRENLSYRIEKEPGKKLISFKGQSVSVSDIFDISVILGDKPFVLADIKGLVTDKGRLALVKEFVQMGFLQILNN